MYEECKSTSLPISDKVTIIVLEASSPHAISVVPYVSHVLFFSPLLLIGLWRKVCRVFCTAHCSLEIDTYLFNSGIFYMHTIFWMCPFYMVDVICIEYNQEQPRCNTVLSLQSFCPRNLPCRCRYQYLIIFWQNMVIYHY